MTDNVSIAESNGNTAAIPLYYEPQDAVANIGNISGSSMPALIPPSPPKEQVQVTHPSSKYDFNELFQLKIISACLRDNSFYRGSSDALAEEYFTLPHLQVLFSIVKDIREKHDSIISKEAFQEAVRDFTVRQSLTDATLQLTLNGAVSRLYSISLDDKEFVREKAVEFGKYQALVQAIHKAVKVIKSQDPKKYEGVLGLFKNAITVGTRSEDMGTVFEDVYHDVPRIVQEDSSFAAHKRVRTGIDPLDRYMFGGPAAGDLICWTASPGVGKSTILTYIGATATMDCPPDKMVFHYIIGDLRETDLMVRYASRISNVPSNKLVNIDNKAEYEAKMSSIRTTVSRFPVIFKEFKPGTVGVSHVESHISSVCGKLNVLPYVVIIDYADRFKRKSDNSYTDLGGVYEEMKSLGMTYDVPVHTASQPKVQHFDSNEIYGIGGMGESSQKGHIVDTAISCLQDFAMRQQGRIDLFNAKMRRGTGAGRKIQCNIDYSRSIITPLENQLDMTLLDGQDNTAGFTSLD